MSDEELRSNRYGPTVVVHLGTSYNSLNEGSVERVERFLLSASDLPDAKYLVVDLSGTQYFGSRFIEALFRAHNRMKRRGGRFALSGLQPYPEEVIRISRLDTIWPLFKTPEEAVRVLGSSGETMMA
jgi:anti-sigma B factor antagonist